MIENCLPWSSWKKQTEDSRKSLPTRSAAEQDVLVPFVAPTLPDEMWKSCLGDNNTSLEPLRGAHTL